MFFMTLELPVEGLACVYADWRERECVCVSDPTAFPQRDSKSTSHARLADEEKNESLMHKDDEDRGRPNDRTSLDPLRLSLMFYASRRRPWRETYHTL
jgi:hypothetical protein